MDIFGIYDKRWKTLMWIPLAALVLSTAFLAFQFATTGDIIKRDIELSGGKRLTFDITGKDVGEIPYWHRITTGVTNNLIIEIPFDANESEVIAFMQGMGIGDASVVSIGPALGELFFSQMIIAIIVAFILMSIVVVILFRSRVPATTVILAAITDIVITVAVMNLLGIELSLPTIAALLTLIGYSVDTDILLTTEVIKRNREDEMKDGIKKAAKTGLMMTMTTIAALLSIHFLSGSIVLDQIASVLIIGLLIDMPATWFTNTGLLRRYLHEN